MRRISLAAAVLLFASIGFGQTSLATVTGTVTDTTGAVIANAPVTLKNLETGRVFAVTSSDTGNYTVSQVPIGDYDLSITSPGFKTYSHTKFHLAASQTMREDVLLEVGQAAESVTVSAESSLLQTESSELVKNVTLSQLDNLPVLQVGATNDGVRDIFSASRIMPGVQYSNTGAFAAVASAVINGTPANTLQTRLDGATMNPTSTRLTGATMETQPSVDSIQEIAIQTSNFAAEFGTSGGAMVNLVSKSGTNQLHGTVYDYATNEVLNAGQPYTGTRNKLRQHDYGFTFGGPVKIPKIYDGTNKTFFFFSFEQFRQTLLDLSKPATVPIPAYRGDTTGFADFSNLITAENRLICVPGAGGSATNGCGDASGKSIPYLDPLGRTIQSGAIFDPTTCADPPACTARNPFPGNRIPVGRFDPVSAKILKLVPQPQGPNALQAGSNYLAPVDESRHTSIPSLKIDQNFGSKWHGAFYYQRTHTAAVTTPTGTDDLPEPITNQGASSNGGRTFRLNLDQTVTPRFLMHYTFGYNDSDFVIVPEHLKDASQLLGIPGQTAALLFPTINSFVGTAAQGGLSTIGSLYYQYFFERRPTINASGTYVRGSHTYKLGFDIRQEKLPNYDSMLSAGNYGTSSGWTTQTSLQTVSGATGFSGFGFASFLLGGLSSASVNAPIAQSTSKIQTALYLQDTWKATRKLTLDYGVRWDYGGYQSEQFGRIPNFSSTTPNPAASGRLGAKISEATCGCKFASSYPYAIGPRLGVAYQLDKKTVIRAGIGVVYNATSNQVGTNSNSAAAGTPAFGQIVGLLQNGIPSNVNAVWPNFSPNAGQTVGTVVVAPTFLDPNAGRPARLLQWNFTLQREIGRNLVVEAAYVGNRGTGWDDTAGNLAPLNVLSQSTLASYGFTDFTNVNDAKLLTSTLSTVLANPAQKALLTAHGINGLPYANFPTTQTVRQMLLAYPQYTGSINPAGAPLGKTWYDGLQTNMTKRFSHGLSLNANYTFSKTESLLSTIDPYNRQLGKNLSGSDLPHQFRFSAQYVVPRLHSEAPVLKNKVVAYALSGWGMGWALSYQSAPLVGLPGSNGATPISQFLGYGPGPAQLKLNADGTPMNPWSVDWTDYAGTHHTDPLNPNCHCFDPAKTQLLNPLAWQNVPDGQFAANQSSIRSFRGIRTPSENANFSRDFRFKERMSLNIRVEFSNVFNRTVLPQPSIAGNFASAPIKITSGPNAGLNSSGFGTINPTAGLTGFRTGSLVARLQF